MPALAHTFSHAGDGGFPRTIRSGDDDDFFVHVSDAMPKLFNFPSTTTAQLKY
jgi:hypothetical protein